SCVLPTVPLTPDHPQPTHQTSSDVDCQYVASPTSVPPNSSPLGTTFFILPTKNPTVDFQTIPSSVLDLPPRRSERTTEMPAWLNDFVSHLPNSSILDSTSPAICRLCLPCQFCKNLSLSQRPTSMTMERSPEK
ncbi:UNVERIFIED_CONTAM: hypothetical protein Sindi_0945900, partial [Sesamum indicum]